MGTIVEVRGSPGRGIKGEGKMDQWIKGKEAIYLNTPMGQRPGELVFVVVVVVVVVLVVVVVRRISKIPIKNSRNYKT